MTREAIDLDGVARRLASKPFRPHRLFKSGHAQTLAAYAFPRRGRLLRAAAGDEPRLFETDSQVRVLVRCRWQAHRESSPTLLLVHGLEGSSESTYVLGTADKAHRAGFNALRMNIRSCGDTQHLSPTLYHSGLTEDLRAVVEELSRRDRLTEIYLAGFSLGGNQCLKFAGESGADAPRALRGVCAVSPSLDLSTCADAISRRSNFVYSQKFVRSLKRRMRRAAQLYPERYDTRRLALVRTIRDFDSHYTAPHAGFRDAADYYARSSALQFVPSIRVPTLIIHAEDDPLVPFDSFRDPSLRANPCVAFLAPLHGGHVGFMADGAARGEDRFWAENRVVEFCRLVHEAAFD
ncbi:MAG TPA: alpha/beta fold hydrolase [Pyrinomonadaceae bacterium]|nr:alpha/beta fold hydrolase [Pyrinomonadaceae bacterium]